MALAQNNIDEKLGRTLQKLREASGMSQTALAIATGLHPQQIRNFERGTEQISASDLCKLSELFGIPPSDFLKGQD